MEISELTKIYSYFVASSIKAKPPLNCCLHVSDLLYDFFKKLGIKSEVKYGYYLFNQEGYKLALHHVYVKIGDIIFDPMGEIVKYLKPLPQSEHVKLEISDVLPKGYEIYGESEELLEMIKLRNISPCAMWFESTCDMTEFRNRLRYYLSKFNR